MKSAEKLLIFYSLFQGVLCREFSITLPESVEALRGLCVLIPCSFEIKEQYDAELQKDLTGIWFKNGTNQNHKVFNSKETKENKIEGEIIGDLHMKNCTTIFYNISESDRGTYYFRIKTSGEMKQTYKSSSVDVRVRVSPISPSITLYKEDQGEVEDQNEVVEGTSVSLICSAPAPPCLLKPTTFTWNFLSEERRQEQNHNASFSSSQLNFKATHLHHGVNFTCTATYQQNKNISAQSSLTLHVLYAPRNTSVSASPSASVPLGSSVYLSCSSDANPAELNYTWYRENGEQIGTGNHLTINTTDSAQSGLYYCRAQNQLGDHSSSVYLDVQYAPQLSPSSSCNTTQDLILCSCEVHGNLSPKLEWRLSGQTPVSPSEVISIWEESASNTTLRSFISIQQSAMNTSTLQCVVSNKLGVTSQVFYFMELSQCSADKGSGVDVFSVLIGVAAGASVMMMLCGIFLCVRKATPSRSGRGDAAGLDTEEDEESVYENKTVLSESLHYSTVVFTNGAGSEIRGLSKLTADYATVHHGSGQHTEGGVTETTIKEVQRGNGMNMDGEKMQEEEVTYGNITRQPMTEKTQLELVDDDDKDDDLGEDYNGTKQPQIEERDSDQLKHSDEAEGF